MIEAHRPHRYRPWARPPSVKVVGDAEVLVQVGDDHQGVDLGRAPVDGPLDARRVDPPMLESVPGGREGVAGRPGADRPPPVRRGLGLEEPLVGELADGLGRDVPVGAGHDARLEVGDVGARQLLRAPLQLAGREVGDGAEAQQGLLVRQRDAAIDHEAGGGVLGVDRVVAGVRLDDDLGRRGVAEAEVHDRAEDLRGQAAHRRVGRRDEHVHAELTGGDPVVRGEHGVRRVVRLGQEGRDAVDPTQPGVVVLVGVDRDAPLGGRLF